MTGIIRDRVRDRLRGPDLTVRFRQCRDVSWENIGPLFPGVIREVVVDPKDNRRLYVASANGGVWRLDNVDNYPTSSWESLTDGLPNLRFRRIVVAPSDSRVIYAATSTKELRTTGRVYSTILRSGDRGGSWRSIETAEMGVVHRLVAETDRDVLLAATSTGLWQWRTDLRRWQQLLKDDCVDVAVDPDDPSIIYLGVRAVGLRVSTDGGASWPTTPDLPFLRAAAEAGTGSGAKELIHIVLGTGTQAVGGRTVRQKPATRTIVVRFGDEINISESGPSGPWRRDVGPAPSVDISGGSSRRNDVDPRKRNEWATCLAIDPFDASRIIVCGVQMHGTADGGRNWERIRGFHHEDQHSVVFDPKKRGRVYCGNDGGVFESADGGWTWPTKSVMTSERRGGGPRYLAKGLVTGEMRRTAIRDGRCLTAMDHLGFVITDDVAGDWRFLIGNDGNPSDAHSHENSHVFACPAAKDRWYIFNWITRHDPATPGQRGRLMQLDLTRTSGVIDWPVVPFPNLSLSPAPITTTGPIPFGDYAPEDSVYNRNLEGPFAAKVDANGKGRLLLVGVQNNTGPTTSFEVEVLRLSSTGTSVTRSIDRTANSPLRTPISAIAFVPRTDEKAWAVTIDGTLYERDFSDPSTELKPVAAWSLPAGASFVSRLVPDRGGGLYLLTQTGIGAYNPNAGTIDTLTVWPVQEERLMSLTTHPERVNTLFLGTNRGVHLSEDGGRSWRPYRHNMPQVPVTDLLFDEQLLYAATFGRGLWRCRPCPPGIRLPDLRRPGDRFRDVLSRSRWLGRR